MKVFKDGYRCELVIPDGTQIKDGHIWHPELFDGARLFLGEMGKYDGDEINATELHFWADVEFRKAMQKVRR